MNLHPTEILTKSYPYVVLLDASGNAHLNVPDANPTNSQDLFEQAPTHTFTATRFEDSYCLMLGSLEKLITSIFLQNSVLQRILKEKSTKENLDALLESTSNTIQVVCTHSDLETLSTHTSDTEYCTSQLFFHIKNLMRRQEITQIEVLSEGFHPTIFQMSPSNLDLTIK